MEPTIPREINRLSPSLANRMYWKKHRFTSLSDPFKAQHVKHPANTVFSISGSHRSMAPALTKILNNRHGILLSSPPAPVRTVSNRRAMCVVEPEPHATLTEDEDLQTVWPNLSSFQRLESCSHLSLENVSVNPVLSPCQKASASSQCETDSLPRRSSLERFPFNKGQRNLQAVCSAIPGVPGMFLSPAPEHNSQEACVQHEQSAAPECRPDGGDVHYSSLTFSSVCPLYSHEEINSQSSGPSFATPATPALVKQGTGTGCSPSASLQPCIGWATPDQLASTAGLQDALEEQLSRQAGLRDRAGNLQRRLQGLLGEQAVRHCSQQLEGLKRNSQHEKVFLNGLALAGPDALPPQAGTIPPFDSEEPSKHLGFLTEVKEFSHCSQLLLSDLQTALDSEATASSSSDEEPEENHGRTPRIISRSCEKQWLEERAALASRCSWLEQQTSELERRIQQLNQVHKRIRSNKGGVVLADSQPQTDRQIQQALMKEITGLSCTGSDADKEACSPRRLLHNIERQSAIVNSLMLPLSFSPLLKQPTRQKSKRTFTSGQRGDVLWPKSCQRLSNRRLFKADVSGRCARTRPLVSYNKPKLFTFDSHNSSSLLDSTDSGSTLSFCLMASSWSCHSSCDPEVLCCDLDCSTTSVSSSSTSRSTGRTPRIQIGKKRRRKRTCLYKVVEYEDGDPDQIYVPEDNSDDVLTGFVRSHQGDSMYINSVLFPMSLTKAERLHYKEIVTPRWRCVETDSLLEPVNKAFSEDEQIKVEDLSDKVFAQRHMALEEKEKLLILLSWGERKYSPRSGSRLSGSVCGRYTSGEESTVECSAQLDVDEQSKSEEQLPPTSWERRVFPLDDKEVASLFDEVQNVPSEWTESTSNSPDLHPDQSSGTSPPSCGQIRSSTPNGSFPCRSHHIENLEQNTCSGPGLTLNT